MSSIHIKKKRKTNCIYQAFRLFVCCITSPEYVENVSIKHPTTTSTAVQCNIQIDVQAEKSEVTNVSTDQQKIQKEMQPSLEKLDYLISTLNNIHQFYIKEMKSLKDTTNIENVKSTTVEKSYAEKGENCLTLLDKSFRQPSLPVILRRSLSEFPSRRSRSEIISTNEICKGTKSKISILHSSFSLLSINFGQFSTSILDNLTTIRTDMNSLKNVFSNIKSITINQENAYVSFACGGLKNCFESKERWLHRSEDLIEAKISVVNFCRFYKLGRKCERRCKKRGRSRNSIIKNRF